jgi:hypothetical protein
MFWDGRKKVGHPIFMAQMNMDEVIGKTEAEAETIINNYQKTMRVTRRDDHYFMGTKDYRLDRVNVTIVKGVVISAKIG